MGVDEIMINYMGTVFEHLCVVLQNTYRKEEEATIISLNANAVLWQEEERLQTYFFLVFFMNAKTRNKQY